MCVKMFGAVVALFYTFYIFCSSFKWSCVMNLF